MGVNLTQEEYDALFFRIQMLGNDVATGALAAAVPPEVPPPAAPAEQPEVFVSNTNQADLNPSTSNGLKMYQTATKAREPA